MSTAVAAAAAPDAWTAARGTFARLVAHRATLDQQRQSNHDATSKQRQSNHDATPKQHQSNQEAASEAEAFLRCVAELHAQLPPLTTPLPTLQCGTPLLLSILESCLEPIHLPNLEGQWISMDATQHVLLQDDPVIDLVLATVQRLRIWAERAPSLLRKQEQLVQELQESYRRLGAVMARLALAMPHAMTPPVSTDAQRRLLDVLHTAALCGPYAGSNQTAVWDAVAAALDHSAIDTLVVQPEHDMRLADFLAVYVSALLACKPDGTAVQAAFQRLLGVWTRATSTHTVPWSHLLTLHDACLEMANYAKQQDKDALDAWMDHATQQARAFEAHPFAMIPLFAATAVGRANPALSLRPILREAYTRVVDAVREDEGSLWYWLHRSDLSPHDARVKDTWLRVAVAGARDPELWWQVGGAHAVDVTLYATCATADASWVLTLDVPVANVQLAQWLGVYEARRNKTKEPKEKRLVHKVARSLQQRQTNRARTLSGQAPLLTRATAQLWALSPRGELGVHIARLHTRARHAFVAWQQHQAHSSPDPNKQKPRLSRVLTSSAHSLFFLCVSMLLERAATLMVERPGTVDEDAAGWCRIVDAASCVEYGRVKFSGYERLMHLLQRRGAGLPVEASPGPVDRARASSLVSRFLREYLYVEACIGDAPPDPEAPFPLHADPTGRHDVVLTSRHYCLLGLLAAWTVGATESDICERMLPFAFQHVQVRVRRLNARAQRVVVACLDAMAHASPRAVHLAKELIPGYVETVADLYPMVVSFDTLAAVYMALITAVLKPADPLLLYAVRVLTLRGTVLAAVSCRDVLGEEREDEARRRVYAQLKPVRSLLLLVLEVAQLMDLYLFPDVLCVVERMFATTTGPDARMVRMVHSSLAAGVYASLSHHFDLLRRDAAVRWYFRLVDTFSIDTTMAKPAPPPTRPLLTFARV